MASSNAIGMAALTYAKRGRAVFPLNGKVPRTKNGFLDATTDQKIITEWWKKSPKANIGMPTTGFVVLDVDPRNGGTESFYKLNEDYGKIPDTRSQKTGGGGFHYIFKCPDGVEVKSCQIEGYPGLDIKAEGGYIVVPPSRTEGLYVWDNTHKVALLPDWLLELITGPKLAEGKTSQTLPEQIPAGKRNSTLFSVAGSMRRRGCEPNEIYAALKEMNARCVERLDDEELRKLAESSKRYTPEPNQDRGSICLSDVESEELRFLLDPYIILGKTLTLDSDPGCGKTYFMQAIAAGLSRGEGVPGLAVSGPGNSLFFVTEDALGDTMKPRFEKLEADCSRIFAVTDLFKFDEPGFEKFEQYIQEREPTLVVIDPITTYLGDNVDAYRDNAVRPILSRLGKIATQHNCAIVIIRHLVKGTKTKAIYAGQNSIAFIASARSGLLMGRDPNNPEYGAAHHIKHNLTRKGEPIGYRIDSDGYFHWTGTSQLTLETILTEEVDSREDEAQAFLETRLSNGPVKAAILYTEAENEDIKKRTLQRANKKLGINVYKKPGVNGPWMWELPTKDATKIATHGNLSEVPQKATSQPQSRLGNLGTNSNYKYIDNKDLSKSAKHGNLNGNLGENGTLKNPEGCQIPSKPRGNKKNKDWETY